MITSFDAELMRFEYKLLSALDQVARAGTLWFSVRCECKQICPQVYVVDPFKSLLWSNTGKHVTVQVRRQSGSTLTFGLGIDDDRSCCIVNCQQGAILILFTVILMTGFLLQDDM